VHKQRDKSYIFSVDFVINLNWKKALFFQFLKWGFIRPRSMNLRQTIGFKVVGLNIK